MQMNGLAELITIGATGRNGPTRGWSSAVLHNNDLNQVTWELRAMGGAPKFVRVPDAARHLLRRLRAVIGPAGDHGRRTRRARPTPGSGRWRPTGPTVLDVHCDPDVPPIPPHATFEQMKDAAEALIKGDENRWGVIKEGLKTKAQELLPHRHDPSG